MGFQEPDRNAGRQRRPAAPPVRVAVCLGGVMGGAVLAGLPALAPLTRGADGVLMRPAPDEGFYILEVIFADGRTPLVLGPAFCEWEVVALWRRAGATLGLALLVQALDGRIVAPWGQIGHVRLGPLRYRRRSATMVRRRPNFLRRRKVARLPERPVVRREIELTGSE